MFRYHHFIHKLTQFSPNSLQTRTSLNCYKNLKHCEHKSCAFQNNLNSAMMNLQYIYIYLYQYPRILSSDSSSKDSYDLRSHIQCNVAHHRPVTNFPYLSVFQLDVHADRLLLQGLDLTADTTQVSLESIQHFLHPLTKKKSRIDKKMMQKPFP